MTFLRSGSKQSDEDWKGMNSCGVHVFGSKRDLMNMHARVLYMRACVPLECLIFFWPRRLISKMWRVVWMGGVGDGPCCKPRDQIHQQVLKNEKKKETKNQLHFTRERSGTQ